MDLTWVQGSIDTNSCQAVEIDQDIQAHVLTGDSTSIISWLHSTDFHVCRIVINLIAAGGDTSAANLSWLILHMVRYPDIQAKSQQEIDKVTPLPKYQLVSPPNLSWLILHLIRYPDIQAKSQQEIDKVIPLPKYQLCPNPTCTGSFYTWWDTQMYKPSVNRRLTRSPPNLSWLTLHMVAWPSGISA